MIIASKISLSRNLKGFLFPQVLDVETSKIIADEIRDVFKNNRTYKKVELKTDEENERYKSLGIITDNFKNNILDKELFSNKNKTINIMINEESHIKINSTLSSDKILTLYYEIKKIEEKIDSKLPFAFDEKFGYLTSNVNILGTGMIPSLIVHIPMLELSGQISNIKNSISKVGLSIRPYFSKTDNSPGGFYEVYSKITLGISEKEAITNLKIMVSKILEKEKILRGELIKKEKLRIMDEVNRALGILNNAKIITYKETEVLISYIKLGIDMKLFDESKLPFLSKFDVYEVLTNVSDEVLNLENLNDIEFFKVNNMNVSKKLKVDFLRMQKIKDILNYEKK